MTRHEGRTSSPAEAREPQPLRVLVANENAATLNQLADDVAGMGHIVVARSIEIAPVAELTVREQPDVALVSLGPSTDHALGLIHHIVREAACPVIALLHAPDPGFVAEASRTGVFAVITDRDPAEWQNSIDVVLSRFAEHQKLREAFLRKGMIERASGILMERHSVDADSASLMLRDTARRRNRKLGELAQAIIDGHSLLPATSD